MERRPTELNTVLEAPGEFLSGLLGVCEASVFSLEAGSVRTVPGEAGRWHILAPAEGRARIAWADRAWMMEPPQAAAFAGSEELSLLAATPCTLRCVTLCGSASDAVLTDCRRTGLFFEKGGLAVERMLGLLSAHGRHALSAREASGAAYQLLMALHGTESAEPAEGERLPLVVEAALGILRREYAFLDGIGELADRLEVSQEYLTRCFCRYMGITPGKYLNQVRIENARLLLRQGGHSVQFVSDACGFTNANYFARVFRAAVGMNPAEYARSRPGTAAEEEKRDGVLYVL